tara:strand:- start:1129 stop:1821 length:693 start_codon:yes stop_codon:yes gene_type:complete
MPDQHTERSILLIDWQGKLAVGLVNLAVYMIGYFSLNKFIEFEVYHEVFTLRIDELLLLPLGGWTIFIYNTCYINSSLGVFLLPSKEAAWRFLGAILIAYIINFALFALWPTTIEAIRETVDPGTMAPVVAWQYQLMHSADNPYTCFPSLHITNCMLVTLAHWQSPRRYWLLLWAVLIAISTITTGQHVFIDILGGILVACAGTLVAARIWGAPLDSIDEDRSNQEPRVG